MPPRRRLGAGTVYWFQSVSLQKRKREDRQTRGKTFKWISGLLWVQGYAVAFWTQTRLPIRKASATGASLCFRAGLQDQIEKYTEVILYQLHLSASSTFTRSHGGKERMQAQCAVVYAQASTQDCTDPHPKPQCCFCAVWCPRRGILCSPRKFLFQYFTTQFPKMFLRCVKCVHKPRTSYILNSRQVIKTLPWLLNYLKSETARFPFLVEILIDVTICWWHSEWWSTVIAVVSLLRTNTIELVNITDSGVWPVPPNKQLFRFPQ